MLGWFLYFSTALSIGSSIPVVDDSCAPVSVISRSCVILAKYSLKISAILRKKSQRSCADKLKHGTQARAHCSSFIVTML